MGLGLSTGVIAGATKTDAKGSLSVAGVRVMELSEEGVSFSELTEVCTLNAVSENFKICSKTGGAAGILILSDESGD